jgi:hypothetical protein
MIVFATAQFEETSKARCKLKIAVSGACESFIVLV